MEGDSPLTVQQVRRVPNLGWVSLADLLLTTENFLKQCIRSGRTGPSQACQASEGTPSPGVEDAVSEIDAETPPTSRERTTALLTELLAAAAELHGAKTLADGLSEETMRLAGKMGIAEEIDAIRIDEMAEGASGLVSATSRQLEQMVDAASETELRIIGQRLLRTPPTTLEEVGSQAGVTRERIRQVQVRVERKMRENIDLDEQCPDGARDAIDRLRIAQQCRDAETAHTKEKACGIAGRFDDIPAGIADRAVSTCVRRFPFDGTQVGLCVHGALDRYVDNRQREQAAEAERQCVEAERQARTAAADLAVAPALDEHAGAWPSGRVEAGS